MLELRLVVSLAGISHSLLMCGVIFVLLLLYFKQTSLYFFKNSLSVNILHRY